MAAPKVSGPGRFSRRTDIPATPGLGGPDKGATDLQYGDIQKLEAGQKVAKGLAPRGGEAQRRPSGAARALGGFPTSLLQAPSALPDEPVTTGLAMGPGEGPEVLDAAAPSPDIRETVLQYLVDNYGNEDARMLLHGIREERAASAPGAPLPGAVPTGRAPAPQPARPAPDLEAPLGGETTSEAPGEPA